MPSTLSLPDKKIKHQTYSRKFESTLTKENEFDNLIELYLEGKITLKHLLENVPDYEKSMPSRVLKYLSNLLQ